MKDNLPVIVTLSLLAVSLGLIIASWVKYGWVLGATLAFLELQCLLSLSAGGKVTAQLSLMQQMRRPADDSLKESDFGVG